MPDTLDYSKLPDIGEPTKQTLDYSSLPDIGEPVKKKEEPVVGVGESGGSPSLSSTPDREFLQDTEVVVPELPQSRENLSFQAEPQVKEQPNYMGLFNKKEQISSGINTETLKQIDKSAQEADYPTSFLFRVEQIKKRLDNIPKYFPDKQQEAAQLKQSLANINKANIDMIDEAVSAIEESKAISPIVAGARSAGLYNQPLPQEQEAYFQYNKNIKDTEGNAVFNQLTRDTEIAKKAASMAANEGFFGGIENIVKGYYGGLGEYFTDYGRIREQLKANPKIKELTDKLIKISEGENIELNTEDRLLAQMVLDNYNVHQELDEKVPQAYKIGGMGGTSAGFTLEFILTQGRGSAAAQKITSGVTKALAEGAAVSGAKKLGVGLAAKLAHAGIQTAWMPSYWKNTAVDVSKGEDFSTSVMKNYYKSFAENFSERVFMKNPWNKSVVGTVDNALARMGVNMHTDKGAVGVVLPTLEEVTEDKISELMTAPVDYNNFDKFWKDYWNVKKNAEMIASVSLMTVPTGIVSQTARSWNNVQLNKIGKLLPSGIRSEIDQVLDDQKLTLKEQYDLVGRIVEDHAKDRTLGDRPAEAAGNIIRYVQRKTKSNVVSAVEERAQTPTVGTMEEITTEDQAKLDYLESKGVKVPDGSTMGTVNSLYEQEKQKEPSILEELPPPPPNLMVDENGKLVEYKPTQTSVDNINPDQIPELTQRITAQINRPDLFSDGGEFANRLGGSGVVSVPTYHNQIGDVETVGFSNPNTGVLDVIMSGTSDHDFAGFYRIYENGKPTNKWSSKMENKSRNKVNFKTMMEEVQQVLPQGHEYTEKTSISTDGLRVWGQQLNRGYTTQTDDNGNLITNRVAINGDAIINELGIPVNAGNFDMISVETPEAFNKVKKALLPYLQKFGLTDKNIYWENGTATIDLPVLRKEVKQASETKTKEEAVSPIEPISEPVEPRSPQEAPIVSPEQKEGLKQTKQDVVGGQLKDVESTKKALDVTVSEKPKEVADIALKAVKDAGYHGGNLKYKAEGIGSIRQGSNVPFTGHYFYSEPSEAISRGDRVTKKKEFRIVDFSKYNLFKPQTSSDYFRAKAALSEISNITDATRIEEQWSSMMKKIDESIRYGANLSELKSKLDENKQKIIDSLILNSAKAEARRKKPINGENVVDTSPTLILKEIGYDGIDVRNTKVLEGDANPNTSQYGSVIFDVKPETATTVEEAYHKAKQDGSNPELVNAVEQLIQNQQPTVVEPQITEVEQLTTKQDGKETSDETQGGQKGRKEVLTTEEEAKVAESTGMKPKNLRDVYTAGREIFGLNKVQALAQAVVVDRVVAKAAKNAGKTKQQIYSEIEFRKDADAFLKSKLPTQQTLQGKRGATVSLDSASIIYALTDPNVSTPLHEIAHVYERYMLPSEKAAVLAWTGHKVWSVETSEKFARGFERYLSEGVAPTEKLKAVFERFKTWLTDIYNGIKQSEIDVELNTEMKRLYDSILMGKKYAPSKEKVATKAHEVPKKTYKDVDDLLFQSEDVKFQDTDKTERHTKALENLISHLESEKTKDVAKEVNDYLKAKGNPISQELIDKVLKEKGYAKGNGTGSQKASQQAQGMVEGEEERIRVRNNAAQAGLEAQKRKRVKEVGETESRDSRLGIRWSWGKGYSEEAQAKFREQGLYSYKPESHSEVEAAARSIVENNSEEDALRTMRDNNVSRRIRTAIGILLIDKMDARVNDLKSKGKDKEANDVVSDIKDTMKFIQDEFATESGRDESFFGSNMVMTRLGGYTLARMAQLGMDASRTAEMGKKRFKRVEKLATEELGKARKEAVDATIKKVVPQKQKNVDVKIQEIRKKRSSLIDQWKKARENKENTYSVIIPGLTQVDIEYGGRIAATYIEEGIYQTDKLIKKLKKVFDQVGVEVKDSDLKKLIPETYEGVPFEEYQRDKELSEAAEVLAQRIFGDVIDKKAPSKDPIKIMVDTLFSKFRETQLDRKKTEKMSDIEKLSLAIKESKEYAKAWSEAKYYAINKITEDKNLSEGAKAIAIERVKKAYKNATELVFSDKLIKDLIRKEISERNMDVAEIVRDHYDRRGAIKEDLKKSLIEKAGLTDSEARILSDAVDSTFETLLADRVSKVVKKFTEKGKKKATAKQLKGADQVLYFTRIGAFDNAEFREAFADMWGIPKLTEEDVNYIIDQHKKIQRIKGEAMRYEEKQKLLAYIANLQGMDWNELIDGIWYANVLSGSGTQLKNLLDANTAALVEPMLIAGTSPFKRARLRNAVASAVTGRAWSNLKYTLETGNHPFDFGQETPKLSKRVLDTKEPLVKNKLQWSAIKALSRYQNVFFDIMMANDAFAGTLAYESMIDVIVTDAAYSKARKEAGRKLTKKEKEALNRKIDELLRITPEDQEIIKNTVDQESEEYKKIQAEEGKKQTGYSERQRIQRTFELMDEMRPVDMVEDARRISLEAVGNINPYGTLGWVMGVVTNVANNFGATFSKPVIVKSGSKFVLSAHPTDKVTIKPFQKVVPFTRIITNIATRNLNWNPITAGIRAATGKYGTFVLNKKGASGKFIREMSPEERKIIVRKIFYTAAIASLAYALTGSDDPEKGLIRITGNGTGDFNKNKQLRQAGWKPWSIQIGDFSISYQYIYPLNMILSPIGWARDQQLYNDSEDSFAFLYGQGMLFSIGQVLFSTPMSGISSAFDTIGSLVFEGVDSFTDKLAKMTSMIGGGFVSPRVFDDIDKLFGIASDRADIEGVTLSEKFADRVPFVGRNFAGKVEAIDLFGDNIPLQSPAEAVMSVKVRGKNAELTKWMVEDIGYFRPQPSFKETTFIVMEKDGSINKARKLVEGNDDEGAFWTEYNKTVGSIFKEKAMAIKTLDRDKEETKKLLKDAWDKSRELAIVEMYKRSTERPLESTQIE